MPWSNQGGDGPQRPEGAPEQKSEQKRGPWGVGPQSPWGGGSGHGRGPGPDFEDWVRRAQEKIRDLTSGDFSGRGLLLVLVAVGALWLASGFYTVEPNQVGLNLVFGRYVGKVGPGLNYIWPEPIGSYIKLNVTDRNSIDIGEHRSRLTGRIVEEPEESLMLTGDENIADLKFRVIWQIDPLHPEDYAFNIKNPVETIKAVAESEMRLIVGKTKLKPLLTVERKVIQPEARKAIQKVLDSYGAGVSILQVQLLSVDPPPTVIAAFRDVTAAQQDESRFVNEAQREANQIVPAARGQAAKILRAAEAYRTQSVAEARGQTARYLKIYAQYKKAPEVTRERLYLETMERVIGSGDSKIILDRAGGASPLLPLAPFNGAAPKAESGTNKTEAGGAQ